MLFEQVSHFSSILQRPSVVVSALKSYAAGKGTTRGGTPPLPSQD